MSWTPIGQTTETSIKDDDGHPLTWNRIEYALKWLAHHANCKYTNSNGTHDEPTACHCTWHPSSIEERESHLEAIKKWPGLICGTCWGASCECGYTFDSSCQAADRWPNGRLRCHGCIKDHA